MSPFFQYFLRNDLYSRIPDDDAISKNRFVLFRIFTLAGSLVCSGVAFKMLVTIPDAGFLPWIILLLAFGMLVNFYSVSQIRNLARSYLLMLIAAFALLHTVAYTCGGIRTGGILYYGVIILYAYMLLGKKGGRNFAFLFAANVIYFYIVSTYTNWTSFDMFKNEVALINEDFLINSLFAFYLIASQGSYLQSGKNFVIQTLEKSKAELQLKTQELEERNFLLKEYTKQLENSNRELDKFASVASHDLKSPLRAIGTLSDFIEEELGGNLNESASKHLQTIKSRVARMDLLLDALLNYSRAARKELLHEKVNTDHLVDTLVHRFKMNKNSQFKIRNILPVVEADAAALQTIFEIVIENAIRFNDKSQIEIEIWSEENEFEWSFHIKDNGPGIDQRFHEKIFVIFQTINSRDTVESTGAGLAIAKRIIENKGGHIKVNSEIGLGAEFRFAIPKKIKNPIRDILNEESVLLS